MTPSFHRLLRAGLVFTFCLATVLGCRSAPEATPEGEVTQRRVLRPAAPEPPPAEELAKSPCGNPDWAKLPGERGEEAGDVETGDVETGDVETGDVETGDVETGGEAR